ncbi:hypothetical protein LTR36_004577 [Oleoguttula mirabilis]|uniref:SH3 domain-containing protein n=1 Tax=Oleoguttula mirabilis TaxID=1507867 RepID=A0AAV9JGX9_9PEZI|nr:hypothetical protein LTR36_004577 [Oleoguttula mirabilis]
MAAPPFKVKAVYEYTSEHGDDLSFPLGQVITVVEQEGDDWYVGQYTDASGAKQEGLFPSNFVEKYEPEVPTRPTRPARPKSVVPALASGYIPAEPQQHERAEEAPPPPAASKPQPPPVEIPAATRKEEEVRSPQSAASQNPPITRAEPPAAPKPAPAELSQQASTPTKAPPPVAPKGNAFKDRIAAFNRGAQAPLAPMQPGRQSQRNDYNIKKPFVAPPPSRSAYIPPVTKVEPVHKPYIREEDPEIKQKHEDDHAAAEAAGLTGDTPVPAAEEEGEDAPKPITLKERKAMLQREQEAQSSRHADATQKKEKKVPPKQPSGSSERAVAPEGHDEEVERVRSPTAERQSLDMPRERPRVPSPQRQPQEPMSPVPAAPAHEILSGGEEADESAASEATEDDAQAHGLDESEERVTPVSRAPTAPIHVPEPAAGDEENDTEAGEDEEEEEEVDEEEQRKQRLRERMARLAGGQGAGPFNPFGAPPPAAPPAKKRSTKEKPMSGEGTPSSPPQQMVAIPGMGGMPMPRMHSPESDATQRARQREDVADREPKAEEVDEEPPPPPRRSITEERTAPPPVPKERAVPPTPAREHATPPALPSDSTRPTPRPPATDSRPVPPPPPSAAPLSPGPGSESDDEMSVHAKRYSTETSGIESLLPIRTGAPPIPASRDVPPRPPQSPDARRASYFSNDPSSATSEKRMSRMPPIPGITGSPMTSSPRPPPPPPPTAAPPSRQATGLQSPEDTERGESDYEGDYDTDIASSAKHKDALKSHAREPSLDDSTTADEMTPPVSIAPQIAPRAVPPPPPHGVPMTRPSMDAPRAPPPVPPPTREQMAAGDYDPYRYPDASRPPPPLPSAIPISAPPIPPDQPREGADDSSADDVPGATLSRKSTERQQPPQAAPQERAPPMPPIAAPQQPPPPARSGIRRSLDVPSTPMAGRRSVDQARPSGDQGQIAQDVDLSHSTQWWTAPQPLPPALQKRNGNDLLSESEESQKAKRGGRTTISKDIYVLYMDYSQTIITAQYDSREPTDVILEQRHEPPPPKLRQDQLESYWQRFGTKIAAAASSVGNSKKDGVLGDGSPYGLPLELIKAQSEALLPVGTRTYGALVYANLANASTMQFDEIRPGDILTARNARFEGHHGAMRQKYKQDYGPSHVAIVDEWDGTRRSVRAWEQGREKKGGVRSEKFRLGDLRSGEVRVWRVVGRDWVGWESG